MHSFSLLLSSSTPICLFGSFTAFQSLSLFFFLAAPHNLWDFSSLIRDWTHLQWKRRILTTGLPSESEVKSLSRVWHFTTPWTVAYQAPLSMGFSGQEYWSGVPFPSPGRLPNTGTKPVSLALQVDSLLLSHQGSQYLKDAWEKQMLKKPKLNGSMKTYRTF